MVGGLAVHMGITPAYAGKSLRMSVVQPSGRDHPRIRGEKTEIYDKRFLIHIHYNINIDLTLRKFP